MLILLFNQAAVVEPPGPTPEPPVTDDDGGHWGTQFPRARIKVDPTLPPPKIEPSPADLIAEHNDLAVRLLALAA